jgi:hypothetical protein
MRIPFQNLNAHVPSSSPAGGAFAHDESILRAGQGFVKAALLSDDTGISRGRLAFKSNIGRE